METRADIIREWLEAERTCTLMAGCKTTLPSWQRANHRRHLANRAMQDAQISQAEISALALADQVARENRKLGI